MTKDSTHIIAEITDVTKDHEGRRFRAMEDHHLDWNYYSKSWHRYHGPKKNVTNRRIEEYNPKSGEWKIIATLLKWPNTVSEVLGSGCYVALLRHVPEEMLPILILDEEKNKMAAVAAAYLLSRKK